MVQIQNNAVQNHTVTMIKIGTSLLSQTAEQTRKITTVEAQVRVGISLYNPASMSLVSKPYWAQHFFKWIRLGIRFILPLITFSVRNAPIQYSDQILALLLHVLVDWVLTR